MEHRGRYRNQQADRVHDMTRGIICAVGSSIVIGSVLLILISLTEYTVSFVDEDMMYGIALFIPITGMLVGTYYGVRRTGCAGLRVGVGSALCYTIIAVCLTWCLGGQITIAWLGAVMGICFFSATIGALMGNLHV